MNHPSDTLRVQLESPIGERKKCILSLEVNEKRKVNRFWVHTEEGGLKSLVGYRDYITDQEKANIVFDKFARQLPEAARALRERIPELFAQMKRMKESKQENMVAA